MIIFIVQTELGTNKFNLIMLKKHKEKLLVIRSQPVLEIIYY